jgi:hypothetical protein
VTAIQAPPARAQWLNQDITSSHARILSSHTSSVLVSELWDVNARQIRTFSLLHTGAIYACRVMTSVFGEANRAAMLLPISLGIFRSLNGDDLFVCPLVFHATEASPSLLRYSGISTAKADGPEVSPYNSSYQDSSQACPGKIVDLRFDNECLISSIDMLLILLLPTCTNMGIFNGSFKDFLHRSGLLAVEVQR